MTLSSPDVDWALAKAVLGDLLELSPEARAAELDRRCADDPALRNAVLRLLASLDDGTDFLADDQEVESSDGLNTSDAATHAPPVERIGKYRLGRELGHGGMGTVYQATQDQPRRKVALKLLHASISSDRITERFVREAELLARMDHPNIARVYEAGTHDDGRRGVPYFAMEFIEDAMPIAGYAEEKSLSVRERVELFLPVCDAVHYGHQRGIIHRDLKPGNILVGGRDQRPRVIDFGVARTTGADLSVAALDTAAHEIIGTLRYMSPEQCSGNANEVDVRCDVYTLGVVLYETLMGHLPYEFKSTSLLEIPRVITEVPPRRLARSFDSDLDTIIRKALEKSRERRYQSVSEFAGDLRRYLDGEPIEAKHDRKWYVLRKTLQRYRGPVIGAAALLVLVASAAVALGVLYARAEHNAQNLRRVGYFQTIALAEHALDYSRTDELRRLLEQCPVELRGWEWWYLNNQIDQSMATLDTRPRVAAALSPDGKFFASGTANGIVQIWDMNNLGLVRQHSIDASFMESMSFSPDGELLAIGTRSPHSSYVLNTRTGELHLEIPESQRVKMVLMLPDGERLATGSADGVLAVRSLETGAILQRFTESGQWITALGVSSDGAALAAGRNNGTIETWDLTTGEAGFRRDGAHDTRVSGLVFSGGSSRLHSSGWDSTVRMWDPSGQQLDVRAAQGDLAQGIALSPDEQLLALVTTTTIELRDPQDGTLVRRMLGQANGYGAAFRADSPEAGENEPRQMVTWSNRNAKVWNLDATHEGNVFARHDSFFDALATSPDGRWVCSAERGGAVTQWDAQTGDQVARWTAHTSRVYRLAYSPRGHLVAGACHDGAVRVWSVTDGALVHEFQSNQAIMQVQWCDDDLVLGAGHGGTLSAWSLQDQSLRWAINTEQEGLASIACSIREGRVATGGNDGTIKIWTIRSQTLQRTMPAHQGPVSDLAWSPDGTTLASGGNDRVVKLWGAQDGRQRAEMVGHGGLIKGVDFNADGTRLATSAWEGEIRLWETAGGTCVLRLRGHVGVVMDVQFTADGQRLVSAGNDGAVRAWDAPTNARR